MLEAKLIVDFPWLYVLKAGIPDGVLNVVPGFGATAGAAICSDMDIDKVTYMSSIWKYHDLNINKVRLIQLVCFSIVHV